MRFLAVTLALALTLSFSPGLRAESYVLRPEFAEPNLSVQGQFIDSVHHVLYVWGSFSQIGTESRTKLAAYDTLTGQLLPWNPTPNASVSALAVSAGKVYVGGLFTTIGGQSRNRIAALEPATATATGAATTWNPNADNEVTTIAINASTIYVSGSFGTIGGQSRSRIAALNASDGTATSWNPGANEKVYDFWIDDSVIYVGGAFTSIGGQSRNRIAALDPASNSALAWNPNSDGQVFSLFLSGSSLYAAGDFTTIGGQSRARLAALDTATGAATAWNPQPGNFTRSLASDGSALLVAGDFSTVGATTRKYAASISFAGALLPLDFQLAGGSAASLLAGGFDYYVAGSFTTVAGAARKNLAVFKPAASLPVVTINGQKSRKTTKARLTLTGHASDPQGIVQVQAKIGSAAYRTINGTLNWRVAVRLKKGKSIAVRIRAVDGRGETSPPLTVKVRRK